MCVPLKGFSLSSAFSSQFLEDKIWLKAETFALTAKCLCRAACHRDHDTLEESCEKEKNDKKINNHVADRVVCDDLHEVVSFLCWR